MERKASEIGRTLGEAERKDSLKKKVVVNTVKCYRMIMLMNKDNTGLWIRRLLVTFEKSVSINKGIVVDRSECMMGNIASFPSPHDHCLSHITPLSLSVVSEPGAQSLFSSQIHTSFHMSPGIPSLKHSSQWPEEEHATPKLGILVGEILTSNLTQWVLKSQRPRPYEFTSHLEAE